MSVEYELGKKIFNSLNKEQRAQAIRNSGANLTDAQCAKLLNGDFMGASALENIANSNPYTSVALSAVKTFGKLFKKKKKKAATTTAAATTTTASTPAATTTKSSLPIIPIAIGAGALLLILLLKK